MKTITNTRNLSIDVVKIIAMFAVVCWHTTRPYVDLNSLRITPASILYRSAVIAIPLFFMVSGYLNMGRKELGYRYVSRKIANIVKFMLVLAFSYWLISGAFTGYNLNNLKTLICESFIGQGPFYVWWYFGGMAILYLIMPLLNKLYLRSKSSYAMATILMLVIQNIAFIQILTNFGGGMKTSILHYEYIIGCHYL